MFQHPFDPHKRRTRWLVAALAITLSIGLALPASAELTPRSVVFHPLIQGHQTQAWGPFTFGMNASEATRASLQSGGRLVPAAAAGQPFTYHSLSRVRGARRSISHDALVWFDGGRLSRVTVLLHGQALARAEACLATHQRTVARVLASGGAVGAATTGGDMRRGPDAQQHAADGGDTAWVAEVWQNGLRVMVETSWEEPASARQAGADETCTVRMTYLPR